MLLVEAYIENIRAEGKVGGHQFEKELAVACKRIIPLAFPEHRGTSCHFAPHDVGTKHYLDAEVVIKIDADDLPNNGSYGFRRHLLQNALREVFPDDKIEVLGAVDHYGDDDMQLDHIRQAVQKEAEAVLDLLGP